MFRRTVSSVVVEVVGLSTAVVAIAWFAFVVVGGLHWTGQFWIWHWLNAFILLLPFTLVLSRSLKIEVSPGQIVSAFGVIRPSKAIRMRRCMRAPIGVLSVRDATGGSLWIVDRIGLGRLAINRYDSPTGTSLECTIAEISRDCRAGTPPESQGAK